MKKIGFIDYRIDEWHANNYPAWIRQACAEAGLDWEIGYVWAEESAPEGLLTTRQWAEKFGVQASTTIQELCKKSDALLILAPSNPEKHLPYAREALKYGKRTYIDKTFAPDAAEAEEIFALSERYSAPIFSTSALRCAQELKAFPQAHSAFVTGGGGNLDEYAIHIVEMIVCLMGPDAETVRFEGDKRHALCHVTYAGGRNAELIYGANMPYTLDVQAAAGQASAYAPIKSAFFPALLKDIVTFFETGEPPVKKQDTMACMRLRDAILRASETPGAELKV